MRRRTTSWFTPGRRDGTTDDFRLGGDMVKVFPAQAVGVGTELISKDALARRDYAAIGAVAKRFLAAVREARDAPTANFSA